MLKKWLRCRSQRTKKAFKSPPLVRRWSDGDGGGAGKSSKKKNGVLQWEEVPSASRVMSAGGRGEDTPAWRSEVTAVRQRAPDPLREGPSRLPRRNLADSHRQQFKFSVCSCNNKPEVQDSGFNCKAAVESM